MGNISTPQIRFPDFKEEWINNSLGEIAKFSKGKGISKEDISETGETECIRYGELYTTYNETISTVFSKTNINTSHLVLSEANDVIIPASGETEVDIAKASCILKSGIALGSDLNIIKTLNNGVFLSYYLNSKKKIDIAKLAQGISVVHLYAGQLSKLPLKIPPLPEQQKIASFFTAIDQKISQLKRKKTLLEQYKKGVMQKIFSQGIRFKDDNGQEFPKWEKKKLKDVAEIKYGKDQKGIACENGQYPIFGTGGVMGRTNEFLSDKPSVLIGRKGTIDKPLFIDTPFWTVDTLFYTNLLSNVNAKWLYYNLTKVNWYKYNEASGVPSLSTSTINKIPIDLPSLGEQTRIANFLSAIDDKINHTEKQIEKAEVWKKGLMQQMFV
ncbi:MAG: restriction endonuclease subunit S [Bacteroidales bacterium]|jgi:type I restriction enzyme S subunit|nr:restriction endonuclease subunit S [Bacteroidales bacterium]